MYAVEINDSANTLSARDLNNPANTRTYSLDKYGYDMRLFTFHRDAIIRSMSETTYTIVKSITPWDATRAPKRRALRGYLSDDSCGNANIIGDRVYELITPSATLFTLYLWDIAGTSVTPLCNQRFSDSDLRVAQWRTHAWVSKNTSWGEQRADSRELCAIVNFATAPSDECIAIATGDGRLYGHVLRYTGDGRLYGHVLRYTGRQYISAIDPRESDCAREVYCDGDGWSAYTFRDVPNGVAVVRMEVDNSMQHVNIFDERSCAMIGTSMMLNPYEYLFCACVAAHN